MSNGRATEEWQKRECLNQILAVWLEHPDLRLGQLIENARLTQGLEGDLFYAEDLVLVQAIIDFGKR